MDAKQEESGQAPTKRRLIPSFLSIGLRADFFRLDFLGA